MPRAPGHGARRGGPPAAPAPRLVEWGEAFAHPTIDWPDRPAGDAERLPSVPLDARLHRVPPATRHEHCRRGLTLRRSARHGLLILTIMVVVLGGGFWSRGAVDGAPPDLDELAGQYRLGDIAGLAAPATASMAVPSPLAAGGSDVMSGYVSQLALAVVPDQLRVDVVTTDGTESASDIAASTGRDVETILWANGLADPAKPLPAGTQLRVPPVDGMLHVVNDGDSLESIAARYQVDVSAITGYEPNNVRSSADLVASRMIMVPGGTMPTRGNVLTYTVRQGDTLEAIAQYFGISPRTIVWANSLPNGDLIIPGQHLAILPTDGVMVTFEEGSSIEALAEEYGVDPQVIRDYPLNGLGAGGQLRVGQQVMIPNGEPPAPPPPVQVDPPPPPPPPEPAAPQTAQAAPAQPAPAPAPPAPAATGWFIWPTNGVITQYFGWTSFARANPGWYGPVGHPGLDIANRPYTPIVAADGGTVIFSGWAGGYGYSAGIDHGNGFVTWYAHMAEAPVVWVGQRVAQGAYLGPMGTTGTSTGTHLHFEVRVNGAYVDPLQYLR